MVGRACDLLRWIPGPDQNRPGQVIVWNGSNAVDLLSRRDSRIHHRVRDAGS